MTGVNAREEIQWCSECETSFPQPCQHHGELVILKDSKLPSKAVYTLPVQLEIKEIGSKGNSKIGIFAKECIQARTRFGPIDAPIDWGPSHSKSDGFELKVEDNGILVNLDINNPEDCNWMMYVRPATLTLHQNLSVIYHDNCIYYLSTKQIDKGSELRVWYGETYTNKIGKNFFIPSSTKVKGYNETPPSTDVMMNYFPEGQGENEQETEVSREADDEDDESAFHFETDPDYEPSRRTRSKQKSVADLKSLKSKSKRKATKKSKRMKGKTLKSKSRTKNQEKKEVLNSKHTKKVAEGKGLSKSPKTSKPPRYECEICNEGFTREVNFQLHVATHTGTLPYNCDVDGCKKGFKNKFLFLRHQNIHKNTQMLSCLYCDKTFRRKDHLKNHMLVHDLNRNIWKCEPCNKSYMRLERYKFHQAMHHAQENDQPHCLICKKDFDSREILMKHLNDVHSRYQSNTGKERNKKCSECGKMFLTNKDVQRHMITHTQKKEFLCDICSQVFGRKDHLTRHVKTSHPDGLVKKTKLKQTPIIPDVAEDNNTGEENTEIAQNVIQKIPITLIQNIEPLLVTNPNEGHHQGRFIPPSYEDVTRKPEEADVINHYIPAANLTSGQGLVTLLDVGNRQGSATFVSAPNDSPGNFLTPQSSQNGKFLTLTDHSYMINTQRPIEATSLPIQSKNVGELLWNSEELKKREYETASYLQSFANGCAVTVPNTNISASMPGGSSHSLTWDTVLSYAKQLTSNSSSTTQTTVNDSNHVLN